MICTTQTMQEILPLLREGLKERHSVSFQVLNPDHARGCYAGTEIEAAGTIYLYRSLRAWMELAEILGCRMLVPKEEGRHLLTLTFEKIEHYSFHDAVKEHRKEKYGTNSVFAQIHKMEEPAFFHYYLQALDNARLEERSHILNLGINRGDEFEVIRKHVDINTYEHMELVGIDHCESAVRQARTSFPEPNVTFHTHDINHLDELDLGTFDLLISIGTLQSPGINFKPFFMNLVQNYLKKDAAVILGFPNSRWIGGEMVYGAKAPNYAFGEMSLVLNDMIFCKKYLQQKKYRVMITGKQYFFLTAVKTGQ